MADEFKVKNGLETPVVVSDETTTPSTPASGQRKLYPKSDGWYDLDDTGTETAVGTSGGNAVAFIGVQRASSLASINGEVQITSLTADANVGMTFSSDTITVPHAGAYEIRGYADCDIFDGTVNLAYKINGGSSVNFVTMAGQSSTSKTIGFSGIKTVDLAADDDIEFYLVAGLARTCTNMRFSVTFYDDEVGGVGTVGTVRNLTTKTGAYTAVDSDSVILCDANSAAFTVTLPTAANNDGRLYTLKKTDSTLNAVTVDGDAAETIDGSTTTTLNTQYESLEIISDASNWHVVSRSIPSEWAADTNIDATNFGTVTNEAYESRRVGDSLEVRGFFTAGTTAASAASLDLSNIALPSSTKLSSTGRSIVGTWHRTDNATRGSIFADVGTSTTKLYFAQAAASAQNTFEKENADTIASSGDSIGIEMTIPINGWKS